MATWKKVLHQSSPAGDFPSGVALSNLGGGSGTTTFLRKDGQWVTPTNTNTTYTAGSGLQLVGTQFSIPAGAIDGGRLATGAIDHPSKLATGVVGADAIDGNAVRASELSVSGNGTTSQFLRSDGDGTFTWATPSDSNTTYSAGNGIGLSGTSFSVTAGTSLSQNSAGLSVTSGGIGTTQLANSSVTSAKLGSQAVTTSKIADEAVTGNEIESGTIESGHLNQGCINHGSIIDNDIIDSQHYVNGSIDAVHLGPDINPVYALHFSLQTTIINGRYYMPNGSYGANYYSWSRYTTSLPTSVAYSDGFYGLPIVVPKAGKIVKWGFHGACNSSSAFPWNWCLKHGTMSNGGTASGTLSTVGSVQNRSSGSAGRYYEWKNTGLSHSVSEDDVLLPVSYGTGSSTRYGRGVFYIVIEYSL